MNVLVLGWYDHNNLGDESYRLTFPTIFPRNEFRFSDTAKEPDIKWADVVVLGGGNILKKHFLNEIKKTGKKTIAVSVGAEMAPEPGLPIKHIYARDQRTIELCSAAGYPTTFCPDLGLLLYGSASKGREYLKAKFDAEGHDMYERVVTVVVNSYLMGFGPEVTSRSDSRFQMFAYEFARVMDETSASFVFVPFGTKSPSDDRLSNGIVASKCKFWKKNMMIFDRIDVPTVLDIVSASNLVISSRLHSSIFSYGCGVPFIDITHHSKNTEFLNVIGKPERSLSYWNFSYPRFLEMVSSSITLPKRDEAKNLREVLESVTNAIRLSE